MEIDESTVPSPEGTEIPTSPAPEGPTNPFARIFGALVSPGETFESIARRPDWLVPLLVWVVISIGVTFVVTPRIDYEPMYRSILERQSQLSDQQREEQLDNMLERSEKGRAWGTWAPVATVPIMFLALGAIFWGALRAFGADNTFRQTFSVTLYAFAPQLIKSIISGAIAATRTSIDAREISALLKSNLGAFTSPTESPVPFAILSSIDLFTIWTIVLFTIGLAVISRFSKGKLAILVVALYLVVVLFKVGMAVLLGGMR